VIYNQNQPGNKFNEKDLRNQNPGKFKVEERGRKLQKSP